jgi:transposase
MTKGRPKGGTNKYWTPKEKYEVIKPILNFEKSSSQVTKETGISNGMICNWIKSYRENGNKFVENKYKRGNPLAKYSSKKFLSKEEQLEYENMKLRIENERLKKGYLVEGDGTVVIFKK